MFKREHYLLLILRPAKAKLCPAYRLTPVTLSLHQEDKHYTHISYCIHNGYQYTSSKPSSESDGFLQTNAAYAETTTTALCTSNTSIDPATGWFEIVSFPDKSAETVMHTFQNCW
jgi:predicted transcriptional regulator